jgi:hypothetical protein
LRLSAAAVRIASSHQARTWCESASATASLQFMPERSRMYFFIFETTMRTSSSTPLASVGPSGTEGVDSTMRRTPGAAGPEEDEEVGRDEEDEEVGVDEEVGIEELDEEVGIEELDEEVGLVDEDEPDDWVDDEEGALLAGAAGRTTGPVEKLEGAAGRTTGPVEKLEGAAARTTGPVEDEDDDDGAEEAAGFEAADAASCACSACQTWRLGLRASTAQASRWRASAT